MNIAHSIHSVTIDEMVHDLRGIGRKKAQLIACARALALVNDPNATFTVELIAQWAQVDTRIILNLVDTGCLTLDKPPQAADPIHDVRDQHFARQQNATSSELQYTNDNERLGAVLQLPGGMGEAGEAPPLNWEREQWLNHSWGGSLPQ